MHQSDLEYQVLKIIEDNPSLTQRQIAKKLGLSLGKTNYLIRALFDKGWVKLRNFRKSNNKIGYLYLLTPSGAINKTKLTEQFLRRKSQEYARLKEEIEVLKRQLDR